MKMILLEKYKLKKKEIVIWWKLRALNYHLYNVIVLQIIFE